MEFLVASLIVIMMFGAMYFFSALAKMREEHAEHRQFVEWWLSSMECRKANDEHWHGIVEQWNGRWKDHDN